MSKQNTFVRLVLCLTGALLIGATTGTSYGGDLCWRPSSIVSPEEWGVCMNNLPCVELEDENGNTYAIDCCETPPAGCRNQCPSGSFRPVPFQIDLLPEPTLKNSADRYHHPPPRAPIMVDHAPISPENIRQFDDTPLYYLACQTQAGEFVFHAFTTKQGLVDQLQECVLGNSSLNVPEAPGPATGGIVFYEDRRFQRAAYSLASGQAISLYETWWDDRITSLRGFGAGTVVTFYENADFSGSSLTLTTDLGWPDLGVFGWDGRASSVFVWPPAPVYRKLPLKADPSR